MIQTDRYDKEFTCNVKHKVKVYSKFEDWVKALSYRSTSPPFPYFYRQFFRFQDQSLWPILKKICTCQKELNLNFMNEDIIEENNINIDHTYRKTILECPTCESLFHAQCLLDIGETTCQNKVNDIKCNADLNPQLEKRRIFILMRKREMKQYEKQNQPAN